MKKKRLLGTFGVRKLLCSFAIAAIVCLTLFATSSPKAFAANNPGLKISPPHLNNRALPLDSVTNVIYPATYFLGCGTGWNGATDPYLHSFEYAYTTRSQACSKAVWDEHDTSQNKICDLTVYIPTILATANIAYGLYRADNSLIGRYSINQNTHYSWIGLAFGIYGIHHVVISSNNGENGTYMAAGEIQFACY
ncbi:hypothetical protein [Ktedonobacter sp. SOSP1-85]|uniref:hypothetical protein n=1 Tax=Ktedonobacter sp. SOSP1-85 TaxID=2778367 RepID=UPI0019166BD1|nr:hypothetical protein [Ktedonobacter sp. SOSP1-85]